MGKAFSTYNGNKNIFQICVEFLVNSPLERHGIIKLKLDSQLKVLNVNSVSCDKSSPYNNMFTVFYEYQRIYVVGNYAILSLSHIDCLVMKNT